jgi:hypothetical protein
MPADKFPMQNDHGWPITSVFETTYIYECCFSKMEVLKGESRNRLDDERWKAVFEFPLLPYVQTLRTWRLAAGGKLLIAILPTFKIKR